LKPGGHALVACGTRTQHRMAIGLEDAGFEIRDTIEYLYDANEPFQALCEALPPDLLKLLIKALGNNGLVTWAYGSGYPKSLDIGKAIDKAAGVEREVVATGYRVRLASTVDICGRSYGDYAITAPATEKAKKWNGWGTALKPAIELWTLCRKPLIADTVAENVLKYGTGGINIDRSRVTTKEIPGRGLYKSKGWANQSELTGSVTDDWRKGRWPSNLIHDGSTEVTALFPESESGGSSGTRKKGPYSNSRTWNPSSTPGLTVRGGLLPDSGSAARFFYCAKAGKDERDKNNTHTTVKPVELMEYLVKLITPPKGIVLDPFAGSGSTLIAAKSKGFQFIGIEREKEYCSIAEKRVAGTDIEKDYFEMMASLEEEVQDDDCLELMDGLDSDE